MPPMPPLPMDPAMAGLPPLPPGDPMAGGGAPPMPMDPMAGGMPPELAGLDPAMLGMDPAAMDPMGLPVEGPPPDAILGDDIQPITEWVPAKGEITNPAQCADIGGIAVAKKGGKDKCCTLLPPEEWDKSWKELDPLGGVMGETASSSSSEKSDSYKKTSDDSK